MHPLDIPTPAALIDETRLMRNIARMQQRMDALGVASVPTSRPRSASRSLGGNGMPARLALRYRP
jgi:Predicted amino acid aldolase or racemase